jgi:hypothetical protein
MGLKLFWFFAAKKNRLHKRVSQFRKVPGITAGNWGTILVAPVRYSLPVCQQRADETLHRMHFFMPHSLLPGNIFAAFQHA